MISMDSGYVQGMSDLCAPIYLVTNGKEELTFWCFVEVMNRMASLSLVMVFLFSLPISETKFPKRPERDEKATFDTATTDWCHGPRVVQTLGKS